MTQTHTSYKVSKMLKKFMGESAPEPIDGVKYCSGCESLSNMITPNGCVACCPDNSHTIPAYQLHDLLSKPFLDAFTDKWSPDDSDGMDAYTSFIVEAYQDGGLPAVEAELMKMMEGK